MPSKEEEKRRKEEEEDVSSYGIALKKYKILEFERGSIKSTLENSL
jgi:hypothetical protein